ncbi:hypothetical protein PAMC26577_32910 [Caballeronia sordidicola]|uniref:Uncharacterized protein n=1 Tax=Caballeronia sordidicola TaxID=196367 RepID=A0A242MBR7_CABSO|nr:hypothetical protein PAMC26577_32910 [Caballeronia sordidicola]
MTFHPHRCGQFLLYHSVRHQSGCNPAHACKQRAAKRRYRKVEGCLVHLIWPV